VSLSLDAPGFTSFDALRDAALGCTACGLAETRTQVVFGVGDPHADLLFVGEGPGEQEDLQGEPFVGRAGQLLTRLIEGIGLTRDAVYIANVV
jgi:DNA polymerase